MAKAETRPTTSRRNALGLALAGAALPLAAALPVVAAAEPALNVADVAIPDDPHPAWVAEFWELVARVNSSNDPRDTAELPEWQRALELADLIAETPAMTLVGVLAQLRLAQEGDEEEAASDYAVATARESAIATIEWMVGEQE